MRYGVVFFDLDGTLTDPTEGITKSVQYALARFGIAAETDELCGFIGPPLHHSFAGRYGFDEAGALEAAGYYREYFSERGIFENRLIEGIPALLRRLREEGAALCVVTSKPVVFAEKIVTHFGLEAYFDSVVGPGLDLAGAEKALLVGEAMRRYAGRAARDFVMVGDREHDVIGAKAHAIESIGVTYGAGSREELVAAGATYVVETPGEVGALVLGA